MFCCNSTKCYMRINKKLVNLVYNDMWPNLRKPTMYCKTFLWVVGGFSRICSAVAKIIFLHQRGGARISKLHTKFDGWSSFVCRDMNPRRQVGWSSLLLLPLKYGDALLGRLIHAYKKTWLMTAALRIRILSQLWSWTRFLCWIYSMATLMMVLMMRPWSLVVMYHTHGPAVLHNKLLRLHLVCSCNFKSKN